MEYGGLGGLDKVHYQAAVTALYQLREEFLAKKRPLPAHFERSNYMYTTVKLTETAGCDAFLYARPRATSTRDEQLVVLLLL